MPVTSPRGWGMLCQLAPPSLVRTIAGHDAPLPDRQSAVPSAQPSCVPTKVTSDNAKLPTPTGLFGGVGVVETVGGGVDASVGVGVGAGAEWDRDTRCVPIPGTAG